MQMALVAAGMPAATAATVSGVVSGISTVMSLMGASSQADNMKRAAAQNAENARITADANKQQADYAAGQDLAAGQREAETKRHKAALMLSRAQAVAAASGGGPLDESLIAGITGEGETDAGYSLYASKEAAAGKQYRGNVGVYEANARGRAEIDSANRTADATMLGAYAKAGTSLFGRFAPSDFPTVGDRGVSAAIDGGFWEY